MSEYSRELHSKLLEYSVFNTRLNDKRVDHLEVNAISGEDFGGVTIRKAGELILAKMDLDYPPVLCGDALITITETRHKPEQFNGSLVKNTDYMLYADGSFSEPEQTIKIYSPEDVDNISVQNELAKLTVYLRDKLRKLENIDADPNEIKMTRQHLKEANSELLKHVEEDNKFRGMMYEYDSHEHQRLLKKLGSLLLY